MDGSLKSPFRKENTMRRLFVFSVIFLTALLALALPVGAQAKSVYAKDYDVDVIVLPNGDLRVVETLDMAFQGGPFTYGFRVIPTDRLDDITNIEVWEGDVSYQPNRTSSANTFRAQYTEDDDVEVRWYFPPTTNANRTFNIAYTVEGAVRRYEEGDEVWWMAVHDDHPYAIRGSEVTLQLPEGLTFNVKDDGEGYVVDTDGVAADLTVSPDGRTLTAVATESLDPGDFLAVGVKFTPGLVSGDKPSWQSDYDDKAAWDSGGRQVVNLLFGTLGLMTLILTPLLVYLLWYSRGRDPHVGLVADYLPEPPDDVPPGVAGTLVDEKADMQDVVATLIDLARRGYLTMTEEAEKGFAGLTLNRDFVFERTDKDWGGLRDYEVTLLRKLFGKSRSTRMSDLKNKFYTALPKLREGLYDAVVEEGYFRSSPDTTRRNYRILGFIVGAFVLTFTVVFTAIFSEWVDTIWCPAVGLILGSVALITVGQAMPAKTKKGAEASARWNAFRRYLKEIERYTDLETATELFERYLPYAIAFNLERRWVQKFARVETTPIPGWYFPYWMMGRAGSHRSGQGRSSVEGGSRPSVQSMSDGLAGGLQSMSDGMVSMFNSVGKTMTSAPSSSGSGGFSGGGFSGGGSSGGGSSGFG
jgi:uncharacterized membrane protein YgcG